MVLCVQIKLHHQANSLSWMDLLAAREEEAVLVLKAPTIE
jgi:hypothetical protein